MRSRNAVLTNAFDDIARRLGVSKGAIYWYFKKKEDLIAAVMEQIPSRFRAHDIRVVLQPAHRRNWSRCFSTGLH